MKPFPLPLNTVLFFVCFIFLFLSFCFFHVGEKECCLQAVEQSALLG